MRGATDALAILEINDLFQSTRPMRGATDCLLLPALREWVSIHAPHAGRDHCISKLLSPLECFNPRAPCGARRRTSTPTIQRRCFNPRAPCGARHRRYTIGETYKGFNPRAPCGARRQATRGIRRYGGFNPRAPCGARRWIRSFWQRSRRFQSTRPMRGATRCWGRSVPPAAVSIHAPHAGRDRQRVKG